MFRKKEQFFEVSFRSIAQWSKVASDLCLLNAKNPFRIDDLKTGRLNNNLFIEDIINIKKK